MRWGWSGLTLLGRNLNLHIPGAASSLSERSAPWALTPSPPVPDGGGSGVLFGLTPTQAGSHVAPSLRPAPVLVELSARLQISDPWAILSEMLADSQNLGSHRCG